MSIEIIPSWIDRSQRWLVDTATAEEWKKCNMESKPVLLPLLIGGAPPMRLPIPRMNSRKRKHPVLWRKARAGK